MQKSKLKDECGIYLAQLTITVLTRNREVSDKALNAIAYAANCVENEYEYIAVIAESDIKELDGAGTRLKLNNLGIEPSEVGLEEFG